MPEKQKYPLTPQEQEALHEYHAAQVEQLRVALTAALTQVRRLEAELKKLKGPELGWRPWKR